MDGERRERGDLTWRAIRYRRRDEKRREEKRRATQQERHPHVQ
jgi:hypothetical protein